MLEAITSAITVVIGWIGSVVDALITTDGALSGLLPLFAIGVAISGVMLGVKVIRSFVWGA